MSAAIGAVRAEAARLQAGFEAVGAVPFETDILQPASVLLDLYGEDIRARAYTTWDPVRGELMLRPDFTVPVVRAHMDGGAEPARYTYAGEVFRAQEDDDEDRPSEYVQVGYEIFDRENPEEADAEVFQRVSDALSDLPLRAAMGDIGLISAAVTGLETTEKRKTALARHLWRPRRFRALLNRYAGKTSMSDTRRALLAADDPLEGAGPLIGLRNEAEIRARLAALREEAEIGPLPSEQVALLGELLQVRETSPNALERLRDISVDMPAIAPAVQRLETRLGALSRRGIAVDRIGFEASYGRTSMEYYDGFVFGFSAEGRPDLPPVATGGRYDALTRILGRGRAIPAVGAVIRPALALDLREGA